MKAKFKILNKKEYDNLSTRLNINFNYEEYKNNINMYSKKTYNNIIDVKLIDNRLKRYEIDCKESFFKYCFEEELIFINKIKIDILLKKYL